MTTNKLLLILITALLVFIGCQKEEQVISKSYFKDGSLSSKVVKKKGTTKSIRYEYYPSGNLKFLIELDQAKRDGSTKYFLEDGTLKRVQNYINGIKHGSYKYYYDNGNIAEFCYYKDNVPRGVFNHYFENDSGKISEQAYFFNVRGAEVVELQYKYDKDGQIMEDHRDVIVDFPDDTIKLLEDVKIDLKLRNNLDYESSILVFGDFDENFYHQNSDVDTFDIIDGQVSVNFKAKEIGRVILRGEVVNKKVIGESGDTIKTKLSFHFFEHELFIK